MTRADYPFGFRVVGAVSGARRLVDAAAALAGHCAADPRAEPACECYLSAFTFGTEFREHLAARGTPKGFTGPCWSAWLWLDIDRPGDPAAALADARRLAAFVLERYPKLSEDDILTFYSGGKGYHLGVPLTHNPDPAAEFHRVAGRLAARLAAGAGVRTDASIYDRVKLFRAPNSRHPRSGLHKRPLTHRELFGLTPARVAELAREPAPCEVPSVGELIPELEQDWDEAAAAVRAEAAARAADRPAGGRVQRETLDFIRAGADDGERALRLFRSAANLRECDIPPGIVAELLTEAGLDSLLPPAEVARQIGCGIDHADRQRGREGGGQ